MLTCERDATGLARGDRRRLRGRDDREHLAAGHEDELLAALEVIALVVDETAELVADGPPEEARRGLLLGDLVGGAERVHALGHGHRVTAEARLEVARGAEDDVLGDDAGHGVLGGGGLVLLAHQPELVGGAVEVVPAHDRSWHLVLPPVDHIYLRKGSVACDFRGRVYHKKHGMSIPSDYLLLFSAQ